MSDKMSDKILITVGKVKIEAQLTDTPTARNIRDALPFASKCQKWGNEVFFETPVMAEDEDNATDVIKAGELAFWADMGIIAIAYGKTPASQGDEIRLAHKCNIWAHAVTDVTLLRSTQPEDFIFIEPL